MPEDVRFLNRFGPVVRKNLEFLFSNLHRFADKIMEADGDEFFLLGALIGQKSFRKTL